MKRVNMYSFGLLFVSLSIFSLPANSAAPDSSASNVGVCEGLIGHTPGLYGLCRAFHNMKDCDVTYDPGSGDINFSPDCKPSSRKLLDMYSNLAQPGDPSMPGIGPQCLCWTEEELDDLGFYDNECRNNTSNGSNYLTMSGRYVSDLSGDYEFATAGTFYDSTNGTFQTQCRYHEAIERANRQLRIIPLTEDEVSACITSLTAECQSRGVVIQNY